MRLLLATLLLIGCQTTPKTDNFEFTDSLLFPFGTYTQKVQVELKMDHQIQTYPFTGVMKYSPKNYDFIGMTFFGSTIFEATGPSDGSRPPTVKLHIKVPKNIQDKMNEINQQMVIMLSIKKNQLKSKEGFLVYNDKNFKIRISKTFSDGTPKNFLVSAKDWHFMVKTTNYRTL